MLRKVDVKLGGWHKDHEGQAALRIYANHSVCCKLWNRTECLTTSTREHSSGGGRRPFPEMHTRRFSALDSLPNLHMEYLILNWKSVKICILSRRWNIKLNHQMVNMSIQNLVGHIDKIPVIYLNLAKIWLRFQSHLSFMFQNVTWFETKGQSSIVYRFKIRPHKSQ